MEIGIEAPNLEETPSSQLLPGEKEIRSNVQHSDFSVGLPERLVSVSPVSEH